MVTATFDDLPEWAAELLADARVGHLGLIDDRDCPRVLPVTYALAGGAVWSAVDDKPKSKPGSELARVRWLRSRPDAALCVDRYSDDWRELGWVQLLGRVEVLAVDDGRAGLAALAERYAPYRERAPGGPLLRLDVHRALHWRPER
jgi:PPOX class probable F420-dependent enzyme